MDECTGRDGIKKEEARDRGARSRTQSRFRADFRRVLGANSGQQLEPRSHLYAALHILIVLRPGDQLSGHRAVGYCVKLGEREATLSSVALDSLREWK